jgi:aerobic-type carbon monoxide dehydrogenase small subunit (CoxS/CutS family)
MASFTLTVNGQEFTVEADPDTPLLWVLRDNLSLTGTKYSCGMGLCGSCTVHLDGQAVRACVTEVSAAADHEIVTIEGLSADNSHPVQAAWLEENVSQCGYCMPGQIMQAAALLAENPAPTDDDIDTAMSGNLCRWDLSPHSQRDSPRRRACRGCIMTAHINRRGFLKLSAFSGALVIGFRLPETRAELMPEPLIANMALQNSGFSPNAYLVINADNTVLIRVHRSEMGQGVNTSVPMILADELEATWDMIRIEQSPPDRVYGDQVTGGSVSMSGSFSVLRSAGAVARAMLISAAAQTWGVDPSACRAENGTVINTASGESLTYGELVETASALPVPERGEYTLKDPADFKFIAVANF